MKIKRLLLNELSIALGHKRHVDSAMHSIKLSECGTYFIIDNRVLIPMFNVIEALVEPEADTVEAKSATKKIKVVNPSGMN